jgi:hypothetical protein
MQEIKTIVFHHPLKCQLFYAPDNWCYWKKNCEEGLFFHIQPYDSLRGYFIERDEPDYQKHGEAWTDLFRTTEGHLLKFSNRSWTTLGTYPFHDIALTPIVPIARYYNTKYKEYNTCTHNVHILNLTEIGHYKDDIWWGIEFDNQIYFDMQDWRIIGKRNLLEFTADEIILESSQDS